MRWLAMLVVMGMAAAAFRADKGPLSGTVVVNKDTYVLDPAQSGKEFRERLEKAKKEGKALPAPPKVDLTLRVTNVSKQAVVIRVGGDESRVVLKLEGPGAVTMENMVAMTMEFRQGNEVKLEPGKSYDLPITSLAYGIRGISEHAYWTEPGEYTIAATLIAAMGDAQVSVAAEAVKVKVEAAK